MPFATVASIRPGAQRARMARLQQRLSACGCTVRIERGARLLVLELPEDDYEWIVTGGLAELLAAFDDCLRWRPRFYERLPARRPRLPAPGERGPGG